ncbi:MAG: TFIIB-type zinc ribbon-containing protein [Armatimonadota bacterium]
MNCPVCDAPLRAIHKYGVEVDICPGCKGVWLDRGELEKIIEMEATGGPSQDAAPIDNRPREPQPRYQGERRYRDDDDDDDDDRKRRPQYDQHGRPHKKRRESWFSELFDGFGD